MFIQNKKTKQAERRRSKWIGFIMAEAMAICVLLLVGALAVLLRRSDHTLVTLANIATIIAGAVVAIVPIVFFAVAPILPRADS